MNNLSSVYFYLLLSIFGSKKKFQCLGQKVAFVGQEVDQHSDKAEPTSIEDALKELGIHVEESITGIEAAGVEVESDLFNEQDEGDSDENSDTSFLEFVEDMARSFENPISIKKQPTRRIHQYFTAFNTHCMGVSYYCQQVCFSVLQQVCRKYKCGRNISEGFYKRCKKCDLTRVRKFPRKNMTYLDFLKLGEARILATKSTSTTTTTRLTTTTTKRTRSTTTTTTSTTSSPNTTITTTHMPTIDGVPGRR